MRKQLILLRILICLLFLGTNFRISAEDTQSSKSVRPYQLRGLRSFSFFAVVGTEIPNNYEIGNKIE